MGNFWKTATGEEATGEVKDVGGFGPLPRGDYPGMFEDVELREWEGRKSIQFRFRVMDGYGANRVAFLTNNSWHEDEKKQARALNLLLKVYRTLGVPEPTDEPTEDDLQQLCDKMLIVKMDKYMRDDGKEGQWMVNVKTMEEGVTEDPAKAAARPQRPAGRSAAARPANRPSAPAANAGNGSARPAARPAPNFSDMDDDIPF